MYQLCRHLKTNGIRCQSPALRGSVYCYFHAKLHKLASVKVSTLQDLHLPAFEDSDAIKIALGQVVEALTSSQIDPRRAGLILYSLQIASQHIDRSFFYPPESVRAVTVSSEGEELAPEKVVCETPEDCVDCKRKDTCPNYESEDDDEDDE
ncbi:MAG: hypothetical protein WBC92_05625 [Terracidiphilus sp.]